MKRIMPLILLMFAGPALAQQVSPFERGTHAYRAVLNRCGLKPLAKVDEALANPPRSLIVLFGRLDVCDDRFAEGALLDFIRAGGAVLFASDMFSRGEMWNQLEISINGGIVEAPREDESAIYRGELTECPLLAQPKRLKLKSKVNLLGDLKVAANRSSFLNRMAMPGDEFFGMNPERAKLNQARTIAELPTDCQTLTGRQQFRAPEGRFLFAIADTLERGRYAVCADHSLFLNLMMLQDDNDNIAFAMKLTRWLTSDGRRTQVHFVDDGVVRTNFDLNIDYVDPPLPHPDVLGPMVDQLVGSLERDNVFNQMIHKIVPHYRILRFALLALTVLASLFFLVRMTSRRHRLDRTVARLPDRLGDLATAAVADAAPTSVSFMQAGRDLATATLEKLLGGSLDTKHPPIVTGSEAWSARVRTIWETATGQRHRTSRPVELERLARDLIDLEKAVARGDVRLSPGANA